MRFIPDRLVRVAVAAAVAAASCLTFATPANAGVTNRRGIVIRIPLSMTSYNGHGVDIVPKVRVSAGVHKQIRSVTAVAKSGGKAIAVGRTVRLKPGTYSLHVKVKYRTFRFVTRHRKVRIHHPGEMPDNSRCVITSVEDPDPHGVGWAPKTADCTNKQFPGQTVHAKDPLPNGDGMHWKVGDVFRSDYIWFKGYDTYVRKAYRVKKFLPANSVKVIKHVTIVDGGRRRQWSHDGKDWTTGYTKLPSGAHFSFGYYSDTSDSCYAGLDVESLSGGYKSLVDETRTSGWHSWKTTRQMTLRFDVYSTCNWTLTLHWQD